MWQTVHLPEHLPIELDSRAWHDDLRRENGVVLAGWRDVLRFNSRDLDHHFDEVVATVRRGLRRAGRR